MCTCNAGFVIKLKILYYKCLVLFLSFTVYLLLLFSVTVVSEFKILPCCMAFHNTIFRQGLSFKCVYKHAALCELLLVATIDNFSFFAYFSELM